MNNPQDEYINNPDFKGFKVMHNGPNHFEIPLPKGKANLRTRAGACMNWDKDINASVSLDLTQHEPHIDGYIFSVLDWSKQQCIMLGWILFDDLFKKAGTLVENNTVYLTIPISKLRSTKELDEIHKSLKNKKR